MDPVYRVKLPACENDGKFLMECDHILQAWTVEWSDYFKGFAGKDVELIVRKARRPNTRQEQNYYRGVIVKMIAEEIGETPQRMHEILQAEFFTYIDDCGYKYVRSTAVGEWSTQEWEEKMAEVRMWAYDFLGLNIPLPNEVDTPDVEA